MQQESRHEIAAFLIVALSAFLAICLLTHDPRDTLDGSERLANACGPVGAQVSYYLVVWLGKIGAYGLSLILGFTGLSLLFRRSVTDWRWKVIGAALAILVLASFEVAWNHGQASPTTLPGGYYGQFFYGFLLAQLSSTGTYLLLGLALLVAFIVSTDTVLYPAFARTGAVVLDPERWESAVKGLRKRMPTIRLPKISLPRPRITWESDESPSRSKPRRKVKELSEAVEDAVAESTETGAEAASTARKRGKSSVSPPTAPWDEVEVEAEVTKKKVRAESNEIEDDSDEAEEMKGPATKESPAAKQSKAAEPAEPAKVEPPRPPLKIRELEVRPNTPRKKPEPRLKSGPYKLPPLDLIEATSQPSNPLDRSILEQTANKIEETLKHFKIEARVVEVQKGPTITQYEVSLAAGIKVHKIINLSDDLAMALKAPSIRIVAPIPGKSTVGVEVPNKSRAMVGLRELIESVEFRDEDYNLPLALGKDVAGSPVIGDLGDMPHLLIAGSTGSGKSVCINSIIINLLLTRTPDEVKLILVDPKMVELAQFENIPHLLAPVVTDMKKAPAVLNWTVDKMEERYELLAMVGVRHIAAYNALGREKLKERLQGKVDESEMDDFPEHLPFIVVIIDELADLMMTASKEVEASITRLSQKSRAVGIHVILATQRPSVDVITGLIKANMPARISFHVASKVDSRTILDRNGAEKLLGKGDMLYLPPGTSALERVQGTFISDKEIRDVVRFAVQQAEPEFSPELTRFGVENAAEGGEEDELYDQAVRIVLGSQRGSVTLLQRQLQIGYTRASRLMEIMHAHGLVGPFKGSKAREVYYTLEEWEAANASRQSKEASGSVESTGGGGGDTDQGEPDQPGVSEEPS